MSEMWALVFGVLFIAALIFICILHKICKTELEETDWERGKVVVTKDAQVAPMQSPSPPVTVMYLSELLSIDLDYLLSSSPQSSNHNRYQSNRAPLMNAVQNHPKFSKSLGKDFYFSGSRDSWPYPRPEGRSYVDFLKLKNKRRQFQRKRWDAMTHVSRSVDNLPELIAQEMMDYENNQWRLFWMEELKNEIHPKLSRGKKSYRKIMEREHEDDPIPIFTRVKTDSSVSPRKLKVRCEVKVQVDTRSNESINGDDLHDIQWNKEVLI